MTIKPVVPSNQKRVAADTDKKESHSQGSLNGKVVEPKISHGQQNVRNPSTLVHRNAVIDGHEQSSQCRAEVYDELTRQRRSPHKNIRSKRRDQHDLHKRERNEREKLANIPAGVVNKCSSPHVHGVTAAAVANSPGSSPTNVTGGNSPENLNGIPVVLGCQSPNSQAAVAQVTANLLKSKEDQCSGYNSGDEHYQSKEGAITAAEWQRRDEQFAKCMSERGYILKPVEEDGACLFRAISLQIYGDEEMHDVVRQNTMDYIYQNREYFCHFVTEDINSYIKRKRRTDSHGNHIEIQAMSEIYGRPVEVYCYKPTPINIFNSEQLNNGYAPLRLSYQRASHYNAIIDPYNATVGVGLGLAGYKPDLQSAEATRLSEQMEIEQTMFEDKLKTTDWEATNEAIEEQIARESYIQWCRENVDKSRVVPKSSTSGSSATITSAEAASSGEASPSKYLKKHSISSTATSTTSLLSATTGIDHVNNGNETSHKSANKSQEHTFTLSTKLHNNMALTLQKDAKSVDVGFESDDTDISSTSSLGNSSPSPSASRRSKRNRHNGVRDGAKRRRPEHKSTTPAQSITMPSNNLKAENNNLKSELLAINDTRACTPEAEQQPCSSKQLLHVAKNHLDEQSIDMNTKNCHSPSNKNISSLYEELLEAAFTTDGYGRLNESEMLQRAIQMSTQDYIRDQNRKYLYGP